MFGLKIIYSYKEVDFSFSHDKLIVDCFRTDVSLALRKFTTYFPSHFPFLFCAPLGGEANN